MSQISIKFHQIGKKVTKNGFLQLIKGHNSADRQIATIKTKSCSITDHIVPLIMRPVMQVQGLYL
jgi:hypothetical protein